MKKKKWSEYREAEINEDKRHNCIDCIYHAKVGQAAGVAKRAGRGMWIGGIYCAYILITGHKRPCSPMNCKAYIKISKEHPKLKVPDVDEVYKKHE